MSSIAHSNHDQIGPRRRPRRLKVAVGAAAVATAAALALSGLAPARPWHGPRLLTFTATQTSFTAPDPAFPKAGDTAAATLRNTREGRVLGTDDAGCIAVTATGPLQCTATVGLPGGTLEVTYREGLSDTDILAPVSGGTEEFVGARGYFALHQTSPGTYRVVGYLR